MKSKKGGVPPPPAKKKDAIPGPPSKKKDDVPGPPPKKKKDDIPGPPPKDAKKKQWPPSNGSTSKLAASPKTIKKEAKPMPEDEDAPPPPPPKKGALAHAGVNGAIPRPPSAKPPKKRAVNKTKLKAIADYMGSEDDELDLVKGRTYYGIELVDHNEW